MNEALKFSPVKKYCGQNLQDFQAVASYTALENKTFPTLE